MAPPMACACMTVPSLCSVGYAGVPRLCDLESVALVRSQLLLHLARICSPCTYQCASFWSVMAHHMAPQDEDTVDAIIPWYPHWRSRTVS